MINPSKENGWGFVSSENNKTCNKWDKYFYLSNLNLA